MLCYCIIIWLSNGPNIYRLIPIESVDIKARVKGYQLSYSHPHTDSCISFGVSFGTFTDTKFIRNKC